MDIRRTTRQGLLAIFISASGTACTTVRQVKPVEYIPKHGPQIVWVTGQDSSVVALMAPHIDDDTLRGTLRGTQDTMRLALTEVRAVTAKVPDHAKTALVIVGLGTLVTVGIYEFGISKEGSQGGGVTCPIYQSTREGGNPGDMQAEC